MYIVDFLKNLFKKNNIGVIIWLILNILLILFLFSNGFSSLQGALVGLVLYVLSMMIALSPVGEWILRLQTGCKQITDPEVLARIQPLFYDVYNRAMQRNPELPQNIKLFMSEDSQPNAFATGRKTVCMTRGLLSYSDEQIKGVLAHEFGHLAHKDTDTILVVSVGNLIISTIFVIIRVFSNLFMWLGQILTAIFSESWGGIFASICIGIGRVIADFILALLIRAWNQLGVWLCMYSSRKNEFLADAYAHDCGLGQELCQVLMSFGTEHGAPGLFAALASSHPQTSERVSKLTALAAPYSPVQ